MLAYPSGSLNEIDRVIVVFFDTRGHGQHVGIENNIMRIKSYFVHQDMISPFTDLNLAAEGIGLSLLVESHDDDSRSELFHLAGMRHKHVLPFLQGDGVDNAFTLHTLQPRTNHFPLGRVNHKRHTGNFRFRSHQIQEGGHLFCRIQQSVVHIDIENQCPIFHLLAGDGQSLLVFLLVDESEKFPRTCHVAAFPYIHEIDFG